MRKLSDSFMDALKTDFLAPLTVQVREDQDLDLQIREDYLNIYYKGNSLLKLDQVGAGRYRPDVHTKFTGGVEIPDFVDLDSTAAFINRVPQIKENIIRFGKSSLEIEYEQMIIRANNYERRNNSEYFIVDRQYVLPREGRIDLAAFYWPGGQRSKGQVVQPCLMEIKFALNKEIQDIHDQVDRYYQAVHDKAAEIAEELETILRQKLALGLFDLPANRLAAMETRSKLYRRSQLAGLPFASQVRIFESGFAMWESKMRSVSTDG
jgi:hypothetical protein